MFTISSKTSIGYDLKQLTAELNKAVKTDSLKLKYQPQISLNTASLSSVEALSRWNHSKMGQIPPDIFIPILEENGLIHEYGELVIHQACRQHLEWIEEHQMFIPIAVNVSSLQFEKVNNKKPFSQRLLEIMRSYDLLPHALEIEITESITLSHDKYVFNQLHELADHGVPIAIDDFGTGFSSIDMLTEFNVSTVKLDKKLVQRLDKELESRVIVKALIEMFHELNCRVIAEGVETDEQVDWLKMFKCDLIQGFYVSGALSAKDITKFTWKTDKVIKKTY